MDNKKTKLVQFKLLILSFILSGIVVVGTGIIVAYIWHQIYYTGSRNLSNTFLSTPFVFVYTFSSLIAAILINIIWERTLNKNSTYLYIANKTNSSLPTHKKPAPAKTCLKYCAVIFLISILIHLVNSKLFLLPEITDWQKLLMISSTEHKGGILILFLSAVILAPLWEEIIFRNIIFKGLSLLLPKSITVLISALLWALAHSYQYNGIILTEIIIIGVILCISRLNTQTIKLPIILHIMNNLIAFISMYYYSNTI